MTPSPASCWIELFVLPAAVGGTEAYHVVVRRPSSSRSLFEKEGRRQPVINCRVIETLADCAEGTANGMGFTQRAGMDGLICLKTDTNNNHVDLLFVSVPGRELTCMLPGSPSLRDNFDMTHRWGGSCVRDDLPRQRRHITYYEHTVHCGMLPFAFLSLGGSVIQG
ncbi:hypothetical protein B0T10DRAFT_25241 [Thelonectria olida]|uniref:Uncharacterized protein n=1 Tax=Thelonectria olida TaxID=1576542 RepID=A0A9P8WIN6_9HYPO|nr:hypothetical protein B0T10DRAFT_25241 [Thelonectria olida]